MSDDDSKKRLTVQRVAGAPAYPASPLHNRGLPGRLWSRFVAKLNTKTIAANTDELRALDAYVNARGALANSMLRTDRAVFDYVEHRDDYLRDDHAEHLDALAEKKHQRQLNQLRREETLRSLAAHAETSAVERAFGHKVAAAAGEAALAEAEWRAARAQWGRDAFQQTLGYRRERLDHLYKTGAIDTEIDRLIAESLRDEKLGAAQGGGTVGAAADRSSIAMLDQMLTELDQEIEIAHATHASDEQKAALYAMRARLTAKRDTLRHRSASGEGP